MPVIHVELFEGRSVEQKRALVRELTDALIRTCGGNAGGELCSDKFPD